MTGLANGTHVRIKNPSRSGATWIGMQKFNGETGTITGGNRVIFDDPGMEQMQFFGREARWCWFEDDFIVIE